ncbi:uncharacterized protein E0L32_007595 [Thyridium curvatum]|uniref:1-alkyl-2-acetylglycerophosphocholine esterase n=1 Tax=Thyridium curvatum TaxID=1093900 RepID=A0A507AXY5_9PEZI|nr:uncharacterized protein E0L32_007595 [Thyridium curvatum]TPX11616.1 hypothetical protein E0L32_007595 [Thyridium curvatum]
MLSKSPWRAAVVAFALGQAALAVEIPQPSGPYGIGVRKHVIDLLTTDDPFAPGNISTGILATIYYPTLKKPCGAPKPYLDPGMARLWEASLNYTAGTLTSLTSNLQLHAPYAPPPFPSSTFPTLVFGPGGGGPPVEAYTIMISEMVSNGFVTVGLDHPYEQPFLRWPNGTAVYGEDATAEWDLALATAVYQIRIREILRLVEVWPALVAGELGGAPFATTGLGAFGHSIGGASPMGAALRLAPEKLAAVINMDGSLFADDPPSGSLDAKRPLLFFGAYYHGADGIDETWKTFPDAQTGWWRRILVNGTSHLDFSDLTFWKTLGGEGPKLGSIEGLRMISVYNEFIRAFFNQTILGMEEEVLNYIGPEWPEVWIDGGINGTQAL